MTTTVTIGQIADALGIAKRSAERRANKLAWKYAEVTVSGGQQRLYPVSDLPSEVRDALARHQLMNRAGVPAVASSNLPVETEAVSTPAVTRLSEAELKSWQRKIMLARLTLVREADRLSRTTPKMRAIEMIVEAGNAGNLPAELQRAAEAANARRGDKTPLSVTSLRRWIDDLHASGGQPIALAPAPSPREKHLPPPWLAYFLDFYALPSKPSVAGAAKEMAKKKPGVALPPLRTIQFHISKMPAIERARGRLGPRALRQLKAFVRRDISDLWPTAVYVTDGHTHHRMVAHPLTGKPFRPEITSTIDVVTRRAVGWSVALSEATFGTIDALRHAFTTSGVPDIWYVDNGSGFNNQVLDDGLVGLLSRFDVEKHNRLPYRSQAGGVIERFHQTWISAARSQSGYVGVDMDTEARKRWDDRVKADIEATGTSPLLISWEAFLTECQGEIDDYNNRPHSSLPKVFDAGTGRTRHMSPNEVWNSWLAKGWSPDVVEADDADFRPQEVRQVRRCEIQLFTNRYFSLVLEEFHERDVLVAYDIHDASRVWVSTVDHQFICEATFYGNSVSFFPRAVVEQAHEKRVENRLKRVDRKRRAVEEERATPVIELDAVKRDRLEAMIDVTPMMPAPVAEVIAMPAGPKPGERPRFQTDQDMAAWLLANPASLTERDRALMAERMRSWTFRQLCGMAGIDVDALATLIKSSQGAQK
jgi:putative transposase